MTKVYTDQNSAIDMNSNKITSVGTPTADYDAATKKYVDDNSGDNLGNHTATQSLNMSGYSIGNVYEITTSGDIYCGDDIYVDDDIFLDGDLDVRGGKIELGALSEIYNTADHVRINHSGTLPTVFGYSPYSLVGNEDDVYITDDLDVGGTLSKGSGSFKIDHPLYPEDKFLYHSFVESPEMRNLYFGQTNTINGKAEIILPEWWDALNGKDTIEFNYQLTPIGKKANCWISKEIIDNKFEISSDVDCKISWQISGIRHDKFAEENRIEVEVDKNREFEEKFPELSKQSDKFEYDEETDSIYKKSKKELFLEKKPFLLELKNKFKEIEEIKVKINKEKDKKIRDIKIINEKKEIYKKKIEEKNVIASKLKEINNKHRLKKKNPKLFEKLYK